MEKSKVKSCVRVCIRWHTAHLRRTALALVAVESSSGGRAAFGLHSHTRVPLGCLKTL